MISAKGRGWVRKGGEQCPDGSSDPALGVRSEKAPREDVMEVGPGGIGPGGGGGAGLRLLCSR